MTHLSRPYQIALGAIALLAAVWLIALRGHSSTSAAGSSTPVPPPAAPAAHPAPSSPYHGPAPGVAGLTRAIEQARGAVAKSEASAKQLGEKSAQASSPSPPRSSSSTAGTAPAHKLSSTHTAPTHASTRAQVQSPHRAVAPRGAHSRSTPAAQRSVEADLTHGEVVAILFWDPHATVDQVVQRELQAVGHSLRGLDVVNAHANQVGAFGSFTRAVQVYGTPTILIINRHGQTTSLSGLTDVYALKQAIGELSH